MSSKASMIFVTAFISCLFFFTQTSQADYNLHNTGEIFAVRIPGLANWTKLELEKAKPYARQYRWIYANASCKDLTEAKEEATKLADAMNRPLLLVYMSRHVFDTSRNTYPREFHVNIQELVKAALSSGHQVLVSGRSYGVHQALRALRAINSPQVLLTGIAPAFGAFGSTWSDNVNMYIEDVAHTQTKYCMIASKKDGFTWRSGGAAYKKNIGYRGDNDVGRAMEKNRANVHIVKLDDANHAPIDEYLNHGLVSAIKQCAYHFAMTDTPLGPITENLGDEIYISDNRKACDEWCKQDDRCDHCSTSRGCGRGFDNLATWKGKGTNWHACGVRESRQEASESNHQACLDWCQKTPQCVGCSKLGDCGPGKKDIRSWTGRGDNWHACAERENRQEASESNHQACLDWCQKTPQCVGCSKLGDCGPGKKDIRSWTGHGDNWHACAERESRQEASKSNHQACLDWCSTVPECIGCSKLGDCGPGKKDIRSWTGHGDNWHACAKRESRAERSLSNRQACQEWCKEHSECVGCSENPGCGYKKKSIRSWTGRGDNWYACRNK